MTPCPLHSMQVKRPRVAASPMSLSQAVWYREAGTWKPRKALPRRNDVQSTATSTRTRANASRSSRRSRECRCSTSWKPFSATTFADGRSSTRSTSRRCATPKASRLASHAPRLKSSGRRVDQSQVDIWRSNFRRAASSRPHLVAPAAFGWPSLVRASPCSRLRWIHSTQRCRGACAVRGISDGPRLKVNHSTPDNS